MAPGCPHRWFRLVINLWPPYLGAGIRVEHIAPDFRSVTVALVRRWYNRNYVGTHFGGSLYAMTDPFFALMLMRNLDDGLHRLGQVRLDRLPRARPRAGVGPLRTYGGRSACTSVA